MRFPPSFIERLRSHFLMSEVIGRRIPLKKHGREYQGLCPFHNEKSPSFTVNDEKGFFHCFGCGAHGDAISFLTDARGLPFMDAVKELAAAAGLELPAPDPRRRDEERKSLGLLEAMEAAACWYAEQL